MSDVDSRARSQLISFGDNLLLTFTRTIYQVMINVRDIAAFHSYWTAHKNYTEIIMIPSTATITTTKTENTNRFQCMSWMYATNFSFVRTQKFIDNCKVRIRRKEIDSFDLKAKKKEKKDLHAYIGLSNVWFAD